MQRQENLLYSFGLASIMNGQHLIENPHIKTLLDVMGIIAVVAGTIAIILLLVRIAMGF